MTKIVRRMVGLHKARLSASHADGGSNLGPRDGNSLWRSSGGGGKIVLALRVSIFDEVSEPVTFKRPLGTLQQRSA